jgi:hypothetical protein
MLWSKQFSIGWRLLFKKARINKNNELEILVKPSPLSYDISRQIYTLSTNTITLKSLWSSSNTLVQNPTSQPHWKVGP